jgi:hypothetical protein
MAFIDQAKKDFIISMLSSELDRWTGAGDLRTYTLESLEYVFDEFVCQFDDEGEL